MSSATMYLSSVRGIAVSFALSSRRGAGLPEGRGTRTGRFVPPGRPGSLLLIGMTGRSIRNLRCRRGRPGRGREVCDRMNGLDNDAIGKAKICVFDRRLAESFALHHRVKAAPLRDRILAIQAHGRVEIAIEDREAARSDRTHFADARVERRICGLQIAHEADGSGVRCVWWSDR